MFLPYAPRRSSLAVAASFAFAGLFAFSANAFAQQKSQAERRAAQEVYWNPGDEPPSMDPTKQADSVSGAWLTHLFEGLMTTDKNGDMVPGAAEKMSVSADGKTYTFTIRKNAKWHDGKPVTAQDFEFAFKRLVDPAYASEYSFIAETAQIVNATEIIGKKLPTDQLGAKALNDSTFEVKLKNPVTFFPSLMAFNTFFPIRKDLVEKHGDKFATNLESLVGNGPFKLVQWQKEASMRMEKAPTYWNAKAIKITALEAPVMVKDAGASYNLFRTGGTDLVGLDFERLKLAQKDKLAIKSHSDGAVFYLQMNTVDGKLFSNVKLRQALSIGINRREYINKISAIPGDKPAFGVIPDYMPGSKKGSTYRKEAPLAFKDGDLAKAKSLVKEYLAETKQAKVPSFTLLTGDSSTAKRDSEYFQQTLSKVFDTEVKVDSVPFKTRLQKMRDSQFDVVAAGWGPDYLDAMTFADLFMQNNSNNHGQFKDSKYDELILSAQKSADPAERINLIKQAEKILIVDKAAIAAYHQRGRAYVLANGLTGVRRAQVGGDPDFRFASWGGAAAKK
ncbi:MAG: peptide ABC transporter substrate-binding protein [Silvanigrellales bacterium]|nr:peptide ABC transporter substrate-binding protein [Silvanigrellales bacterium]